MQEQDLKQAVIERYRKSYEEDYAVKITNKYDNLIRAYVKTAELVDSEKRGPKENSRILKTRINSFNNIKDKVGEMSKVVYSAINEDMKQKEEYESSKKKNTEVKKTTIEKQMEKISELDKELKKAKITQENEYLTNRGEKLNKKKITKTQEKLDKLMVKIVEGTIKAKGKKEKVGEVAGWVFHSKMLKLPRLGLEAIMSTVKKVRADNFDLSDELYRSLNTNPAVTGENLSNNQPQPQATVNQPAPPNPPGPVGNNTSIIPPSDPTVITPTSPERLALPEEATKDYTTVNTKKENTVVPNISEENLINNDVIVNGEYRFGKHYQPATISHDQPKVDHEEKTEIIVAGQRKEPNQELSEADKEIAKLKAAIAAEEAEQQKIANANKKMQETIERAAVLYAERQRLEEQNRIKKDLELKQAEIKKLKETRMKVQSKSSELNVINRELSNVFTNMRQDAAQGKYASAVEISKAVVDTSNLTQADRTAILDNYTKNGFSMDSEVAKSNDNSRTRK